MNSEERDLISRFVARVGGGQGLPEGQAASLPPVDPEADRFIAENFQRFPEARYRITQLAVVQEAALAQAQSRIRDLEFQLQQARGQITQLQQAAQGGAQQTGQSGGFFSGLFTRGQAAPPPRGASLPPGWGPASGAAAPAPDMGRGAYAAPPGYQPGMFPRSGSGFLGSALTTAAGVAGGMMAANALEGLFSGGHGHGGFAGGDGYDGGGDTTIINNNYGDSHADNGVSGPDADPFAGSGTEAGGFSQQDFGPQADPGGDMGDAGGDFGNDDGGDFF